MNPDTGEFKPASDDTPQSEMWAIVEIMGHVKLAGLISEWAQFGTALLRVDVPEVEAAPAHTEFFGGQSIYRITPCGEQEARLMAAHLGHRPIQPYVLRELADPFGKQLPLPAPAMDCARNARESSMPDDLDEADLDAELGEGDENHFAL